MDFCKEFPVEINFIGPNYLLVQNLDYKNVSFHCRTCYEIEHSFKKIPISKKVKAKKIATNQDGGMAPNINIIQFLKNISPQLSVKMQPKTPRIIPTNIMGYQQQAKRWWNV